MLSKDFYGSHGLVWWNGLVETINDPAKLQQCQVRIIGIHSIDKQLCPTETLPWAQVMHSPTGAKTQSGPVVGDWVFGFFLDNHVAQIPIISGVFPGVESKQSREVYEYQKQVHGDNYYPIPSQEFRSIDQATTFRSVRGIIEGTLTDFNNHRLDFVCDISNTVRATVAWARVQFSQLMLWVTKLIKSIVIALGMDPTGLISSAVNVVKRIVDFLRWIRDIIEVIRDWMEVVRIVVARIRELIAWILSLPQRLIAFLTSCLNQLLGGISAIINGIIDDTLNIVTGPDALGPLVDEIGNAMTEIVAIGSGAQEIAQFPEEISNVISDTQSDVQISIDNSNRLTSLISDVAIHSEVLHYNDVYYDKKYTFF